MRDDINHEQDDDHPSRSERRRNALSVLALAEQLVALSDARIEQAAIPDDVRAELVRTRRITAHGAHKRQLAYVAKLMRRHDDATFDAARALLGADRERGQREAAALQRVQVLRDALLAGDPDALTSLIDAHPDVDRQRLRALIRQARAERQHDKPPRAARALFRLLRDLPAD